MIPYTQSREASGLFRFFPSDIFEQVVSKLSNVDIKNLRQTCTYLKDIAHPRIHRLFLSANLRDIEVFRAVADHEILRHDVTEIIYDDARLGHTDDMDIDSESEFEDDIGDITGVPEWYPDIYRDGLSFIAGYDSRHIHIQDAFKNPLTPAESFKVIHTLFQQQQETITTNRDADALEHGLSRFPNLRRLTITPAAHGLPGRPLYPTHTIRSLPQGLIYPLDRGWPVMGLYENEPEAIDWAIEERCRWRGYLLVTRILAQHLRNNPDSKVTDLVLDTNQLRTGISCRIFDGPENNERSDLITILSQPGFTRLDLSIHCGNQYLYGWCSFRSGHLRSVLAMAPDLQHISLFTNITIPENPQEAVEQHFLPLRSIFPVSDWHQLRHFGLSRFLVKKDDVIELLQALPPTIMSVELSFLLFLQGDYHALLQDMQRLLDWREKEVTKQPNITIRVDVDWEEVIGAVVRDLSREVVEFVYQDGENPFVEDEGFYWSVDIPKDIGMLVDVFGPDYK